MLLLASFTEHSTNKIRRSPTKHQEGKDHILKGTVEIRITTKSELDRRPLTDSGCRKDSQEEKPRLAALKSQQLTLLWSLWWFNWKWPHARLKARIRKCAFAGVGLTVGWAVKQQKPMPGPNAICLKTGCSSQLSPQQQIPGGHHAPYGDEDGLSRSCK